MQEFYQTYISEDQETPYRLLAEADPGDILGDDLLSWGSW